MLTYNTYDNKVWVKTMEKEWKKRGYVKKYPEYSKELGIR
jgi:hypothetical protein